MRHEADADLHERKKDVSIVPPFVWSFIWFFLALALSWAWEAFARPAQAGLAAQQMKNDNLAYSTGRALSQFNPGIILGPLCFLLILITWVRFAHKNRKEN
jgi:hypothetical protein